MRLIKDRLCLKVIGDDLKTEIMAASPKLWRAHEAYESEQKRVAKTIVFATGVRR